MDNLPEIRARLQPHENALRTLKIDLSNSFNFEHGPVLPITHHAYIVESLLRDLWDKLGIHGSPARKNIEALLQVIPGRLRKAGHEMPLRIDASIRTLQMPSIL